MTTREVPRGVQSRLTANGQRRYRAYAYLNGRNCNGPWTGDLDVAVRHHAELLAGGRPGKDRRGGARRRGPIARDSNQMFVSTATPEEDALIVELYTTRQFGIQRIGKRIHRSNEFILTRLAANGVKTRKRGGGYEAHFRLPHNIIIVTKGLYDRGHSISEIAEIMKTPLSTVRYRLRAAGVKRRSNSEAQRLRWSRKR